MRTVCFFLAFSYTLMANAQHDEAYVDDLTNDLVQKLTEGGVESYFIAKRYCAGAMRMIMLGDKMCASKGTYYEVYLVYEEAGQGFMQKVDNCGVFEKVAIADTFLSQFMVREWPALKDDIVKPYLSETYTGTPELRKTPQPCFRSFTFHKGTQTFEKEFNLFDISNDSDGANKNYTFNQTLKLVKINTLMDEILPQLTFNRI